MFRTSVVALALAASLASVVSADDAKPVVSAASKAMGADTLKTIQYSGAGAEFAFGQAFNPSLPWPSFPYKSYTRVINFETPAWRTDKVLADLPPGRRGGGLPPAPTQVVVVNPGTPWAQQVDLWMTPFGFLRAAAAASDATARSQTMNGKKYTEVTFTGQNKAKVNGYVNAQDMVERVETWVDNPVTGDTLLEATYTNYKDFAGVKFPTTIVVKQGGYPILDLTVDRVTPNAQANIPAPAGRGAGGGAPPGGAPATTSVKLGDDVYTILGGYATVAVGFKDYVVAIEGGQSEERALAIIGEIKKLFPGKPIKYVVNTHSHFDHSSGLRAWVAEGVTIVTYQSNKGYFEKVLANPHTLVPDTQAQANKKIVVETIGDKKVLTDGNHVVEIYRLLGSVHNEGLLIAYLPKEKVLVEADVFNPPAQPGAAPPPGPPNAGSLNLVANLERLKLDVDTIVPIHYPADNRKVTKADLMKAIGRAD